MYKDLNLKDVTYELGKKFNVVKWITIVGCGLLFVLGLSSLSVGIASLVSDTFAAFLAVPGLDQLAYFMISVGGLVILASAVGAIGAFAHKRALLLVLVIVLGLLVVAQLFVGIAGMIHRDDMDQVLEIAWDTSTNETKKYVQDDLTCCGYQNSTDAPYLPCPTVPGGGNITGCQDPLNAKYDDLLTELSAACLAISVLEFIGALMCVALMYKIQKILRNQRQRAEDLQGLLGAPDSL
ncbi:hypothetical protein Pelo_5765 [Pelomyxa schiedti]|nr:hypothetical protein Pelo_5765 [Pelomyxa schiedti]